MRAETVNRAVVIEICWSRDSDRATDLLHMSPLVLMVDRECVAPPLEELDAARDGLHSTPGKVIRKLRGAPHQGGE